MPRSTYGSTGYYALRWFVLRRDNFTCQYCGQHAPNVKLEVDHVSPIEEGGGNEPDNLKTSCWACNRGKSGLSIIIKRRRELKPLVKAIPSIRTRDTITHRLLEHLKTEGEGSSLMEICQYLHRDKHYCSSLLNRLKKRGQIINTNQGLWMLDT